MPDLDNFDDYEYWRILFGASENLSGTYDEAAWISVGFNFLLFLGTFKAVSYYRSASA